MDPKYKTAIDQFIDDHFQGIKQKVILYDKIPAEAFYFLHYPNRPDKKFGWFPIPQVDAFFKTGQYKQYLAGHIQNGYELMKAAKPVLAPLLQYELVAVILMTDMQISKQEFYTKEEAEGFARNNTVPAEDPAKKDAIGYHVYLKKESFTYYYFYTRRTHQACFELPRLELMQAMHEGTFANLFPKEK